MKLTFNKFKKMIIESLLNEDKSRLIDRLVLPDIEDEEEKQNAREEMKSFFKKYNTWENKLDWNKLSSITYADFEKIKDQATQTKGSQKREIASGDVKAIFKSVGDRKFEIVGENENWLFVSPLTYEAAVYCDSSENQGAGAKWCIGYEQSDEYWRQYTDEGSLFIMAFNKNYKSMNQRELQINLKYMIQRNQYNDFFVWNQADKSSTNTITFAKRAFLEDMFEKVKVVYQKVKDEKNKIIKQQLEKKFENLKNIDEIPSDYFTQKEQEVLTEIVIPNNVKSIQYGAFSNCDKLTKVVIGNGVTSIGGSAFWRCEKLTDVTISSSVKKIGNSAFAGCTSLINIDIPEGVESIGQYAFSGCENLTNVTISDSVVNIREWAFYRCRNLTNVTMNGKTFTTIKNMNNYPWDIRSPRKIIKPGK